MPALAILFDGWREMHAVAEAQKLPSILAARRGTIGQAFAAPLRS